MAGSKGDHSTPILDAGSSGVGMTEVQLAVSDLKVRLPIQSPNVGRRGNGLHSGGQGDPDFGSDQVEGEAKPEGGAEKFAGGEMREAAGGEEDADDGTYGGYGETNGVSAKHPLAVESDFAPADVPEGFAEREQEQGTENSGGSGLVDAADGGHGDAHDQCGDSDD